MKAFIAHALVTAMTIAVTLFAYDRLVARPAQRIGIVDVGEVYRLKEAEFTRLVTHAVSDDERRQALATARRFAQRLPPALEELPRDCRCLVIVRTAIAGVPPNAIDLTALLKRKVELP